MSTKPYYTTSELMKSIRNRIMMPFSQSTLSYNDVLQMVNEELQFNAVPSVRQMHQEYFVYKKTVPILSNIGIYPIPDRAQAMMLRDLNFSDSNGNFFEMQRISEEDKGFFQYSTGTNQTVSKYYIQGDTVVLSPQMSSSPSGELNFFIFLRPNYLVRDERAAFITGFQKPITVTDNSAVENGDTITITLNSQSVSPTILIFTAVSTSPSTAYEFQIGANSSETMSNFSTVINALGIEDFSSSVITNTVTVSYSQISTLFDVTSAATGISVDNTYTYVQFDNLASTFTDPETNETSDLFVVNGLVDFLQTKPGHKTFTYDIKLKQIMSGNVGKFLTEDLKLYQVNSSGGVPKTFYPINVGDYICLANECIIPQLPSESHSYLAEMTASRILSAIGDKEGYDISQNKLGKMDKQQAVLIGNRVEGSVQKVFNSSSLLRMGRRRRSSY